MIRTDWFGLSFARGALLLAGFCCSLGSACGGDDDYGADANGAADNDDDDFDGPGSPNGPGGGASGAGGAPPEQEFESKFLSPVATGRYVWVANPTSNRVAYIDAVSLRVNLVEAGHEPTYLAAVPSQADDVALALNVRSKDATILRARPPGVVESERVPVPSPANAWGVSPDGQWAVAWTDTTKLIAPDPVDGFQSITVLGLGGAPKTSTELSVGYRPVAVAFDQGGTRAFVITQDGVSIVALGAAPAIERSVPIARPGSTTRDVVITPDGGYALVRFEGASAVTLVPLAGAGAASEVPLPGEVTDLDLAPGGAVGVAVVRATGQVALLPMPAIVSDPTALRLLALGEGVGAGSAALSPSGGTGFFYTNATPNEALTVVDTAALSPSPKTLLLRAPVKAVFPTDDAKHALVLHDALPAEAGGADGAGGAGGAAGGGSKYAASMSLVPADGSAPPRIVGLERAPAAVALAPGGAHALVATGDALAAGGNFMLYVTDFPSLRVREVPLASAPTAAGVVAGAGRGYVAQQHPDGRITFVDFESGEVRTLTGFELAAGVVDGSEP